jgi:FkbM family methyltransferase
MVGNPLKRAAVGLLKHRPLGVPAAAACRAVGARDLSRKISRECGFVPAVVDIEVPAAVAAGARFLMHGIDGRDQVARAIWLYGWDAFEKPIPDLFGACSREARRVFDVGAYSGFYTHLAVACNPRAEVLTFEPFPLAREWLTRNLALNGTSGRARVLPAAVSDRVGEADLFVPPNVHGWVETSSSLDREFHGALEQVLKVTVVTLDDVRHDRGGGPVDLMKIDVEMLEHRVLGGSRRILAEDRPILFMEVLPQYKYAPELDAIREEAGYLDGLLHPDGIDWRDRVEAILRPEHLYENNHVFCPSEKRDWLEEIARSLGYRVSRMQFRGEAVGA